MSSLPGNLCNSQVVAAENCPKIIIRIAQIPYRNRDPGKALGRYNLHLNGYIAIFQRENVRIIGNVLITFALVEYIVQTNADMSGANQLHHIVNMPYIGLRADIIVTQKVE